MLRKLLLNIPPVKISPLHYPVAKFCCEGTRTNVVISKCLQPQQEQQTIFDLSFRQGDKARALLNEGHKVLGLEANKQHFDDLNHLESEYPNFVGLRGKVSDIPRLLEENDLQEWAQSCTAVIIEFGPSSSHLKLKRGLDPSMKEPLDLRMGEEGLTCREMLTHLDQVTIAKILSRYGSVVRAKEIGTCIVENRYLNKTINTTEDLTRLVVNSIQHLEYFGGPDGEEMMQENVEKVFLALRLFVNDELSQMKFCCDLARTLLPEGGKFIASVQSQIEEKHLRTFLFEEMNQKTKRMDWKLDNRLQIEDENGIVLELTRQPAK